MEIDPAVVVIGSVCAAAALLYFVSRIFTRNAKVAADSGASPVQVAEQERSFSEASNEPAPQPPVEQTTKAMYETVQPETAPQPVASNPSPAVIPFAATSNPEQQVKPYRRRSHYTRTRNTSRTVHTRKHTKQE